MELSWTTFLLEAINFLVLVWLLKRLFYAPVKRAIAARRAAVEKTLQDAETERREAEDLKAKYEGRLQEWEQEKERQREEFRKELGEERAKQLKVIEDAVKTGARKGGSARAEAIRRATCKSGTTSDQARFGVHLADARRLGFSGVGRETGRPDRTPYRFLLPEASSQRPWQSGRTKLRGHGAIGLSA